ncbi:MAG: hypothetical protein LBR79_06710 [Oscillospiraceae bacterium]|jgi:hypothetical protein|nr:hypothetical protein [Oscillospiraceae bacterium]
MLNQAHEILEFFQKNIEYGILDVNGKVHRITDENFWTDFSKYFILKSPEELLKSKIGVCFDQVELSRNLFAEKGILTKSYFICYYENLYSHSILVFEYDSKFYWLETSHRAFIGIHEYDSEEQLLRDFKHKFVHNEISKVPENHDESKLKIFEYDKPKYRINCQQYFDHMKNTKEVKL